MSDQGFTTTITNLPIKRMVVSTQKASSIDCDASQHLLYWWFQGLNFALITDLVPSIVVNYNAAFGSDCFNCTTIAPVIIKVGPPMSCGYF